MKIIKEQLIEKVLTEAEDKEITLSDVNPAEDSVDKIAAGLQGSIEEISDGEKEVPDSDAQTTAAEIKDTAIELNAGAVALDDSVADTEEEALGVENELTKKLDLALRTALSGKRQGTNKNANVLVTGLPGSGKTSIVFDWAKTKGINVYDVSASDPDLEAAVYGLTLRDNTVTDKNITTKATSNFLDKLDRENSVLFLDEFNRASSKLRRALLQLVNEHAVADPNYPNGLRPFKNLLFTVACVNPGGLRTDKNAEALNDAEKSRFALKSKFDSNVPTTIDYFKKNWDRLISKLDKKDKYYLQDLEEYLRCQDLGIYLVSHPDFAYDDPTVLDDLADLNKTMLNQRELTDGLNISGGDVEAFRDWVENSSEFLDEDINMILHILSSYTVPTFEELIKNKEAELQSKLADEDTIKADQEKVSTETTGEEEIEDDADFFAQSATGKSAVTPGEVENIINDLMANW